MKVHPMGHLVLVRPTGLEDQTSSGVLVPESAKQSGGFMATAEVIEVGPGSPGTDGKRYPMDVEKGDIVAFSGNARIFPIKTSPLARLDEELPDLALIDVNEIMAKLEYETPGGHRHALNNGGT